MINSDIKRSAGKGQVIHTSLKEMESPISDFPSSNPTPGVLARAVYHHGSQKVVVEIYHESPLIISPGKGDFIDADPNTVDEQVRSLLFSIAERCQTQGEELINHAQRLLEIASQENVLDEIDEDRIRSKAGYISGVSSISKDVNVVSIVSSGSKQVKQPKQRVSKSDLLSMLADDDDGDDETGVLKEVQEVEEQEEQGEQEEQEEDDNLLDLLLEED